MENQWKSMKISKNQCKIEFFRDHSVPNIDFDERYLCSWCFWMILALFWMILVDFSGVSHGFGAENQGKSMKLKGKSMKINKKWLKKHCKPGFFVVTASQMLIVMKFICFYNVFEWFGQDFVWFWWVFKGFYMVLGWKFTGKQGKSTNIDRRSSLLLLKTVLHSCKRDLNMYLDGVLPFLGGPGAVFNEKSWKIMENSWKIIEQTRKINESW